MKLQVSLSCPHKSKMQQAKSNTDALLSSNNNYNTFYLLQPTPPQYPQDKETAQHYRFTQK